MLNFRSVLRNHNNGVEKSLCSSVARYLTILLFAITTSLPMVGGEGSAHGSVKVMHRVNLANADVKAVVGAWIDSLEHWRGPANVGSTAQDRSNVPGSTQSVVLDWFSQTPDVISTYPPTVLSVEATPSGWMVRTMFSTTDPQTGHVIPLGILRSTFLSTGNGRWMLVNPLTEALAQREATSYEMITYVHDEGAEPNPFRVSEATRFIRSTADRFDVAVPEQVTMVLSSDRDDMCALLGLEYYAFPPTGLAFPDRGIILSSMSDPFYPHELAHVVLRPLEKNSHPIIREGVATWLGGSITTGMTQLVQDYLAAKDEAEIPSFLELFTDPDLSQDDQYILGAAICATIARTKGDAAVKDLLKAQTASEVMLQVKSLLGVDPTDTHTSMLALLRDVVVQAQAKPGR
jgi:hypothetical protein